LLGEAVYQVFFPRGRATPAGAGTNQAKAAAMRLELAYESERRIEQRYGSKYIPQRHRVLPVGATWSKAKGRDVIKILFLAAVIVIVLFVTGTTQLT
jgi:hypothetical protein